MTLTHSELKELFKTNLNHSDWIWICFSFSNWNAGAIPRSCSYCSSFPFLKAREEESFCPGEILRSVTCSKGQAKEGQGTCGFWNADWKFVVGVRTPQKKEWKEGRKELGRFWWISFFPLRRRGMDVEIRLLTRVDRKIIEDLITECRIENWAVFGGNATKYFFQNGPAIQ